MSEVKTRLLKFIDYLKMPVAQFERSIDVSSGYVKNISKSLQPSVLERISLEYPVLNIEWILIGRGKMLREYATYHDSDSLAMVAEPAAVYQSKKTTRPRVPYAAAAGSLTHCMDGIKEVDCEQTPVIHAFPEYNFTILIKGDNMVPKYESGDEVACKRIDDTHFIQWGKVHVLDTAQGIVIKRIYEEKEGVRCVSYNPEYPDFTIPKEEIYSMSLVVGLLRV